ncbi:MAG: ankyrin repeat domain-containing protein [Planctomycetaceae bacterium]|nr:ankyrin repeat domain-containing protein [Planctomycetaceae bacterium]
MRYFTITVIGGIGLCLTAIASAADAPLADAVERQDAALVQRLLADGVAVDQTQADGMTALHWAAHHDDLATAKRLIAAGADAKAANRYGVTPLSLACTNGNGALVERLLDAGADPNGALRGGETVLMTAARTGRLAPVKSLLACGADVNAKERKGQTAVMWAAAEGHAEVVQILIDAGAEFRTPLKSGFTPLMFAAREGRIEAVQALLKAGADVNEVTTTKGSFARAANVGTGPLILAIENGHFELAAVLLKAGADANDQRSGFGPLHMLAGVRKPPRGDGEDGDPPPQGSGQLSSLDFVRTAVAHGADVNLRLKKGISGRGILSRIEATPFLLAASTADMPLMKLLVELDADPLLPNAEQATPLMAAAGVGCRAPGEEAGTEPEVLEALAWLIERGGDINAVDDNGETAMHGAAYKSLPLVVQFLADRGAKIDVWNRSNKHGWTPLVIAHGYRVGNFKPSQETIAALRKVMLAAGVTPPENPKPLKEGKTY